MTGHAVPFGKSRLHRFVSDDGRRGCSFFARGDRVAAVGVIAVIASRRETERMDGGWPCRARALTRGSGRLDAGDGFGFGLGRIAAGGLKPPRNRFV